MEGIGPRSAECRWVVGWATLVSAALVAPLGALPIGAEFVVNTYTDGTQRDPVMAVDPSGRFVVAWESRVQDGELLGIFARRFDSAGVPTGVELQVNSSTLGNQRDPAIGVDEDGDFVVAWESAASDIFAQRLDSSGARQGGEFQVNDANAYPQRYPAMAVDGDGDFVVVWESDQDFNGTVQGVFARRFTSSGAPQATEFRVTASMGFFDQWHASVTASPSGDFVVAWQSDALIGNGVRVRRFDSAGVPQGLEAGPGPDGVFPAVGMAEDKSFVVAWTDEDPTAPVRAVRFTSSGGQLGASFAVEVSTHSKSFASVDVRADGDFVVAWNSLAQDGADSGVFGRRFASSGVAQGGTFQINTYTLLGQGDPAVGTAANGDFFVAWERETTSGYHDVIARRVAGFANFAPVGGDFQVNTATLGIQAFPTIGADDAGKFVVAWASLEGVFAQRFDATGSTLNQAFRVNSFTTGVGSGPSLAMQGDGDFVVSWFDATSYVRVKRFDSLGVQQGAETEVYTASLTIPHASVGIDSSGNFVVVWETVDDLLLRELRVRRFDSAGNSGLNTLLERGADPVVAVQEAGAFVVVFEDLTDDSSGLFLGILGRRFDSYGVQLGGQFVAHSHTTSYQYDPAVASSANGDFVVTWTSPFQTGGDAAVFARRFASSGTAKGAEFQVNVRTDTIDRSPAVAMDDAGNFVIVWQATFNEPVDERDVFGRFFDAEGSGGKVFQVNAYTSGRQFGPDVAMDADGEFTVVWNDTARDGDLYGIFARRFRRVSGFVTSTPEGASLDIDANGTPDALTDGVLGFRYVFGFRGATLIDGAVGAGAERDTAEEIEDYLDANLAAFDIDGNGSVRALSDALMMLRYLFGVRDAALIAGAIGPAATRTTEEAIENYLGTLD